MSDILRPELLRFWREAQVGIDLPLGEELHCLGCGARNPVDVLARIEAHICHHAREEYMLAGFEFEHSDALSLQIADCVDLIGSEQLETTNMAPGQYNDRLATSTWMLSGPANPMLMLTSPEARPL